MRRRLPEFQNRLLRWYDRHRRDLPWRLPRNADEVRLDPYHVLVSEAMLQQTQVATVIPYFTRFIARFPTIRSLAAGDAQEVLCHWQGLGYYSRARNLHAAAHRIVADHGGRVPESLGALLDLPGIGRYTAGAIASIAFDQPAAILDGNVSRVLARLDLIDAELAAPATRQRLWARAAEIIPPKRPGDFNSALMELGAMVCTPRAPKCPLCPVARHCEALAAGLAEKLPRRKKPRPTPLIHRSVLCIRNGDRWLLEQRPANGRWASMWQFITIPANGAAPNALRLHRRLSINLTPPRKIATIAHALTHRRYIFDVYTCDSRAKPNSGAASSRTWVALDQLTGYPLPRPHVRIAGLLAAL